VNVRLITLLYLAGFALVTAISPLTPSLRAQTILGAYATVRVAEVNVRTGPGAGFAILDTVQEGQTVAVIGRLSDCSWLQVVRPGKGEGWVASPLVILSRACRDLPLVAGPTPVAAQPAPPKTTPVARAVVAEVGQAAPTPVAPAVAPVAGCPALPDEHYGAVTVSGPPSRLPAAAHPDLNLALRGYEPATAPASLIHIDGPVDSGAPQLTGLFADRRRATVTATYQVYDWDWECDCRGALISGAAATLVGLQVAPGEAIYTPDSPRTIGSGYEALVLYATTDRITIKFTREDNVVSGYTLHVEGICVEAGLLARYRALDGAGRKELPALRGGQPFGRAQRQAMLVAIRDNGQFLDPRGRPHWWR
jgi:SH3-like domain-containing protein